MIRLVAQTALVCFVALSAAGCAVEVPKSAFSGFMLAPPDGANQGDAANRHQDLKPLSDH